MAIDWKILPRDEICERRFAICDEGRTLFYVGFNRMSLLSDIVYITLELVELPPRVFWRSCRRLFDQYQGYLYYCQIARTDATAARFAEFFGFQLMPDNIPGRLQYQKDTR